MSYSQAVEKIKKLSEQNAEFDRKIKKELSEREPMTDLERREQVLNFVMGSLHDGNKLSRDEVEKIIFRY